MSKALPAQSAFPLSPKLTLPVCLDMAGAHTHELACFTKRIVLIWNWQRGRKSFFYVRVINEVGERREWAKRGRMGVEEEE